MIVDALVSIECSNGLLRRYNRATGSSRPSHIGVLADGWDLDAVVEEFRIAPSHNTRVTRDLPLLFPMACEG